MKLRQLRTTLFFALGLAVFLGCSLPAMAGSVLPTEVSYTLDGVFCDGGGFNGYVVVDFYADPVNVGNYYKSIRLWDITVTPPTGSPLQPVEFTPSTPGSSATVTGDPLFDVLAYDPFHLEWSVNALDPLSNAAVEITGGFYADNLGNCDCIHDGTMTPTPEPTTWALMTGGGLVLLGMAWRRRRLA